MKKRMFYFPLMLTVFSIMLLSNCKKKEDDTNNTSSTVPVLTTTAITGITSTSATGGGNISSDGNAAVTSRGVCWSTSQNPTVSDNKTTDGTGTGTFSSTITGLTASTTYYARAYATNSTGTGYGNQVSFTTITSTPGTVTDYDGNVYNTITIGTQVWMKENLKVTHYRDGSPISKVTDGATWATLATSSTGAYCWYNNDSVTNGQVYGALYNWYAVNDSRKIAPAGWHVPTDAEWTTLETYLGGVSVAGGKLKETGTTHWASPNTGATNESGFTALPGGYRYSSGTFAVLTMNGLWWTATEGNLYDAKYHWLFYDYSLVTLATLNKKAGLSVRLIKD